MEKRPQYKYPAALPLGLTPCPPPAARRISTGATHELLWPDQWKETSHETTRICRMLPAGDRRVR